MKFTIFSAFALVLNVLVHSAAQADVTWAIHRCVFEGGTTIIDLTYSSGKVYAQVSYGYYENGVGKSAWYKDEDVEYNTKFGELKISGPYNDPLFGHQTQELNLYYFTPGEKLQTLAAYDQRGNLGNLLCIHNSQFQQ
jgi:hypothetical protein